MSNIINLQLSVFCNKHIEPTPEKISSLMASINSTSQMVFLPSIVTGQSLDISTGQVVRSSNLVFVTKGQESQIQCMDNRIDFIINETLDFAVNYKEHLSIAERVLAHIMSDEKIDGNRLALNIQILDAGKIRDVRSFINKYGKPFGFYESKQIEEWMLRYNSREAITVAGNSETLNVVTSLSIVQPVETTEKRLLCHMDINTLAEKDSFRFSYKSVSSFIVEVNPIVESIKTSFGSADNDN